MTEREKDEEFGPLLDAARRLPRSIEPVRDLWPGIAARLARGKGRGGGGVRALRRWVVFALAAAAILVPFVVGRHGTLGPRGAWEVARLAGAPLVGATPLAGTGSLRVGDWLVTDDSSQAVIRVGRIGRVEVKPETRIRLLAARSTDHRLALERGEIYAQVDAPPRLFFVETPSAVTVDLGCAYTLRVDSAGNGLLHVTGGIVEVQWGGRNAIAPLGTYVVTRRSFGPGTPYVEDASETFRRALAAFDFERAGAPAVRTILALARRDDALSLWHLLFRVEAPLRGAVYDRLAQLAPPPPGVSREAGLRLDRTALDRYWNWIPRTVWRPDR